MCWFIHDEARKNAGSVLLRLSHNVTRQAWSRDVETTKPRGFATSILQDVSDRDVYIP